jgi:predicted transcriptional regulator
MNSLSKKIGVTARMIDRYEKGDSDVTLNKALKIYRIFGEYVFNDINIFSRNNIRANTHNSDFSKKYVELGFKASDTKKSPFDVIAKKDKELVLTDIGDKAHPNLSSVSRMLDASNLVIFDKKKPKDIPAVTKVEFLEFEESNQLLKFLKEFTH